MSFQAAGDLSRNHVTNRPTGVVCNDKTINSGTYSRVRVKGTTTKNSITIENFNGSVLLDNVQARGWFRPFYVGSSNITIFIKGDNSFSSIRWQSRGVYCSYASNLTFQSVEGSATLKIIGGGLGSVLRDRVRSTTAAASRL
jgi:hypothetical protein